MNVRDNFGSVRGIDDVFVGIDDSLDNDDEAAASFEVEIGLGEGGVEADVFILMLDVEYDRREPCNERLE